MSTKYPGSAMSDQAVENDENLGVELFDVNTIYSDHDFNCRIDAANPMDSIELARSIADNGLIQPIVLRDCGEQPEDPEGYKYVIVAGYRRYQAYRVNNHPVIPAVKRSKHTKEENVITNLLENLKRKDLNLLEQAKAIAPFYETGWSREEIADKLGMSKGWVQLRCMLLELDPLVQNEFAANNLVSTHIRQLYTLKDDYEAQIALAREIKNVRQSGDKRASTLERIVDKKPKATSKKRRTAKEIEDMMEHLHETFGTYGLTGRALAWCAGHIANYEFLQDIRDECIDQNLPYAIPDMEL